MASKLGHSMAETVWWLVLHLIIMVKCNPDVWGNTCPAVCTCHQSYFEDLPLSRWLKEDRINENILHMVEQQKNEAYYEEDTHTTFDSTQTKPPLLKMAMCVFQSDSQPLAMLRQLPTDIQVLSILQGRDSDEIVLQAQHMQGFQNLIYIEVQGYHQDTSDEILQNNLLLSNDILQPLVSLQYLNFQHVKLLGSAETTNKLAHTVSLVTHVDPLSNEITINIPNKGLRKVQTRRQTKGKSQNLVFLNPSELDSEIVPYKTYVEEQERSELSTFAGLSNLLFLRVFGCGLNELNWEMFDGLDNLQYLSLEKNYLLFIPEFVFYGAPNLKILSLAHNKLLNLQSTSLAGLLKLEKLDLSHNKFSHLSELSLPPFPKLQTANFKHNPIEAVFASTFEIMNATTTLYLGGSGSVLDIHPNSFLGLESLTKLSIYNVGIPLLERQLLSGMPQLKELDMAGTIISLSFDAFLEVPNLEKLVIKECKIQEISMDAFYGLYGLLYLDLSNNKIASLPPGLFDQQFSLKELLLQNNLLTELPNGFFSNMPAKMIRLEGNPWHCSCAMKDWQPAVINKVKQKRQVLCQVEYDKGSMCSLQSGDTYLYEKRVSPRCTTPDKYKDWNIFHVLRKELRCSDKLRKKLNTKAYLTKKYKAYERSKTNSHYKQKYNDNEYIKSKKNATQNKNSIIESTEIKSTNINLSTNPSITIPITVQINNSSSNKQDLNGTKKHDINIPTMFLNYSTNTVNEENNEIKPIITTKAPDKKLNKINDATKLNRQLNTGIKFLKLTDTTKPVITLKSHFAEIKNGKGILKEKNKDNMQSLNNSATLLKKEWKLEMERKHQEKLKKYQ